MRVPALPTPELGIPTAPAPHPGTRRVAAALAILGLAGASLAVVMLQERAWVWVALYATLAGTAWATWRACRWARPVAIALAVVGTVPPGFGIALGAGDATPLLVFGAAIAALVLPAATLLTRPARTWFATACARRTLA